MKIGTCANCGGTGVVAAPATHDLSVYNGDVLATEGEDYSWDGGKLTILTNDLTVTGTTENEFIWVDSTVTSLTIKDLSITAGNCPVYFVNAGELTLKGTNVLTADDECKAVESNGNLSITGDGDLTATSSGNVGIYSYGMLSISASGTIVLDSSTFGIYGKAGVSIASTVTDLTVYGADGDYGAITWDTVGFTLGNGLTMTASADYKAATITGESTVDGDHFTTTGEAVAKSIKIVPAVTHDLTVKDDNGDSAVEGTKDDHENADYYWDGNDLVLVFNENTVLDVSGTSETESVIVASEQYATGDGVVCLVNASFVDLTIKAGKVAVVDGSYEDGSIALRNFTLIWGEIYGAELTATGTISISDADHYLSVKNYGGDPATDKRLVPKPDESFFRVKTLELVYVPDNYNMFESDEYNLGREIDIKMPKTLFYKDKSVCKIGRNFKLTVFSTTDGGATWIAVTGSDLKDGLPYKVGDYKAKLEAQFEASYVAFAEDYFSIVAAPVPLLEDAFAGKTILENEYIEVDDTTVPGTRIVKLLKNITMSDDDVRFVIPSGKDFILDLNNCTLDRGLKNEDSAVEKGNLFTVNGKLTIRDTSGTKNGKLTGATSAYGAAIISNGETVLESGSITDCKALSEDYDTANSKFGRGGAIYVPANGKFTMTGGEIKNCSATVAGGAIFNCGTVTITDGKIDGCSVSGLDDGSGTVKAKGGAVYNFATSNFTMTGGEISGNTLGDVEDMRGAGVYTASGAIVTLGGTAKITGNTNGKGKANNLFLYEGNTFAVSTDVPPTAMNIGVNSNAEPTEDSPVKLADLASDCSSFFRSDLTGYSTVYTDDALYLCVKTADPCVYNKKADSIEDGKVYNLYLGGKDAGWYTLIKVDGGWKICQSAEPGMVGVIQYPTLL